MRPDLSRQQKREKSWLKHNIRKLNKVDTTYIEPQRYNYAFMIQNTNTYELYRIKSNLGYSVTFAPNMSLRVGPYFGYRWIFIGYTIDVTHLYDEVNDRTDFNLSLYSNKIGLDLYYRKTGDGYYIRSSYFGDDFNTEPLRDVKFGGVTTSNKGFNAYYIFNHRKFSYPAAFSQSTVQRRSAGSPLIGIGYSNQNGGLSTTSSPPARAAVSLPRNTTLRGSVPRSTTTRSISRAAMPTTGSSPATGSSTPRSASASPTRRREATCRANGCPSATSRPRTSTSTVPSVSPWSIIT